MLLIVDPQVIDATWKYSREMYKTNIDWLGKLDSAVLDLNVQGQFVVRRPPKDGLVSTLEAIVIALQVLDPTHVDERACQRLMAPLHATVDYQQRCKQARLEQKQAGVVQPES
jgi:DTW domain-containing protein YfiP